MDLDLVWTNFFVILLIIVHCIHDCVRFIMKLTTDHSKEGTVRQSPYQHLSPDQKSHYRWKFNKLLYHLLPPLHLMTMLVYCCGVGANSDSVAKHPLQRHTALTVLGLIISPPHYSRVCLTFICFKCYLNDSYSLADDSFQITIVIEWHDNNSWKFIKSLLYSQPYLSPPHELVHLHLKLHCA